MPAYKVEICGVNTAKLPILKETEKEALFARIRQGDQEAREMYIKGNLRLVLSVIKRFSAGKIFHLCGTYDHRGDPQISA